VQVTTLVGIVQQGTTIIRLLHRDNLAQQLRVILEDRNKLGELALAIEHLDTHLRVLRLSDVDVKGVADGTDNR
jgi:hypothetical protein